MPYECSSSSRSRSRRRSSSSRSRSSSSRSSSRSSSSTSTTARTDVLPGKVCFDCAGPMFCEIPRVVRLGKRMTNFSLISSTSSSSASSATSSTSSTSQLTVKFNGGGSLLFPNTLVDLPN